MTRLERRAYQLGAAHRHAGRKPLDLWDGGDVELMDRLGQTSPTTEANWPARLAMCSAYDDGWDDANKALGVRKAIEADLRPVIERLAAAARKVAAWMPAAEPRAKRRSQR